MNPIIKPLALCALLASAAGLRADTTVFVKASANWLGYMNVFNLPTDPVDPGLFRFGSGWGVADLRASISGSTLTLSPNTIGDPNEYWYQNTSGTATPPNVGGPGQLGNKIMEANLYVEVNDGSLSGQEVTFTGNVSAFTLTNAHTTVAFIKDFAPDYSSSNTQTVLLDGTGTFSVSLNTLPDSGRHVQYGFQTTGENVWVTDVAPFGNVQIDAVTVAPGNPNATVDPAAAWQGYLNVFEFPSNGGTFLNGAPSPTTALAAAFSGPVLTLRPNSTDNPEYYTDGVGNKNMEANLYVQALPGRLSGQTVNFSGVVDSNTLPAGYTAVAFVKDFAPDYSSSVASTAPLAAGAFSVSLATINDPQRHIQYGLQILGPPVPLDDILTAGSVVIQTNRIDSYNTWLSGFDFTTFTSPNLSETGDPDADGLSNFTEFALNSNPTTAAPSGKFSSGVATVGADGAMLMTLPVFHGAVFTGSPAKSGSSGQISYQIEGSNSLAAFDQAVSEVVPAQSEGLPTLSAGWGYRTFRLDGAVDGATPRGPKGFLRARTSPTTP
jgi:hypothetical protein